MSRYGICDLTVIPLRAASDDRSELVSQLLFGETFEILDTRNQWRKVRTRFDSYEGWIDEKQMQPLIPAAYQAAGNYAVCVDKFIQVKSPYRELQLMIGSNIPNLSEGLFKINEETFQVQPGARTFPFPDSPFRSSVALTDQALKFLDTPYWWGGRSLFGIDCSGFTQLVFKLGGYTLKRDAHQQAEQGATINLVMETRPGDLAFFENAEHRIIHVGIILPDQKIIHASGRVRIDDLDHYGIFNQELKKYTHQLRLLKRIL